MPRGCYNILMSLASKNVLVGVTGGIAAYKIPELVRRLIDAGANVRVVMTPSACEFVRPLVFQAVSGNPVHTELLDEDAEAGMGHIELARWPDLILIAPATANTLASFAAGLADNLLATLLIATTAPVAVVPAMNTMMWEHPATTDNVDLLIQRGVAVFGPGVGSQACGETGAGRMLEVSEIIQSLQTDWPSSLRVGATDSSATSTQGIPPRLTGHRVLITAGPTREAIDPVRFLSNHSSGKMGFALAAAAVQAGAQVTLVSGPVNLATPAAVERIDVTSAVDMQQAVMAQVHRHDIFISVAAVADYRVAVQQDQKIKKTDESLSLSLIRNPDILATVSSMDKRPYCVGFAAETEDVEQHARGKLERKNLDMIIANQVGDGRVFGKDTNAVEVFMRNGHSQAYTQQSKTQLASALIQLIADQISE